MTELIGYIAAFLTTASLLPQAFKTIKTGDTSGISLSMYVLSVVGIAFWCAYGTLLGNWIIIVPNAINFILAGIILVIKIRNFRKEKKSK